MLTRKGAARILPWLAAPLLIALTVAAYLPVIRNGGFIWDDDGHVTDNVHVRSADGLRKIWTAVGPGRGGTIQYYPLTFTAFWIEHRLWQYRPFGYHLVNVLLHALNAVLVWRILLMLGVPGALLAAAIFAVHPVHVESAAWITQMKNLLSGFFYLLSMSCFLKFHTGRSKIFYGLSIMLFLCALGAKTAVVTLPAAILLILWWKTGHLTRKDILSTAPLLILAITTGFLTAHVESTQTGAVGPEWTMTPVEHVLLAGRIIWFYAGKLLWPFELAFIYPRWTVSQAVWWQYLFPLAVFATFAILWRLRKRLGRGPLAAVLFFAGTVAPALGFFNIYFMRFSYVADHYQYLASLGPIALVAAAATRSQRSLQAMSVLLLPLAWLTWRQSMIYESAETLWRDTLAKNPSCWLAHTNLGVALMDKGPIEESDKHFTAALRLRPEHDDANYNFGVSLHRRGRIDEAILHYEKALRNNPNYANAHNNLGQALETRGRMVEAVAHYEEAARLLPNLPEAHNNLTRTYKRFGQFAEGRNNLGVGLARLGKLDEAAAQYREAIRLNPDFAAAHYNLGLVLAQKGELDEAVARFRAALKLKPDYADARTSLSIALAASEKNRQKR